MIFFIWIRTLSKMYCFYIQYFPVLWHWCWGELKKIAPTQLISYRALILNFFHHFIPIYILITTPVSSSCYFYFIRNIVPYSLSAYLASVLIKFSFFFEKLIEKKMVIDNNSLKYGRNHHFLEKKNLIGRFYTFGYHWISELFESVTRHWLLFKWFGW